MKRKNIVMAVCVLALMAAAPGVYGQTAGSQPAAPSGDQWQFHVTPYFWATQIDSKVTVDGYSAKATTYFSDIWDNLAGAGLVHVEALKGGKWGFFADAIYLKLRADGDFTRVRGAGLVPPPTRDLTLTMETWIVEFGGLYQIAKWPVGDKGGQSVTVDLLGGARYWYLSADLDTSSRINPSGSTQWVDPFFGARLTADITKQFFFNLRGDVGGFGVGSDITWNGAATFGYRFTPMFTGLLGYRVMYIDYKGSSKRARYEETFQGPTAGLTISF